MTIMVSLTLIQWHSYNITVTNISDHNEFSEYEYIQMDKILLKNLYLISECQNVNQITNFIK